MNKNKFGILNLIFIVLCCNIVFASGAIDYNLKPPTNISLTSDGVVKWDADASQTVQYKTFQIKLLKRTATTSGGTTTYSWTEFGSTKTVSGDERSAELTISSSGVYRVKVRAVNADGNFSIWTELEGEGIAIESGGSSGGGGSSSGGGVSPIGPGSPTYPAYYVGPDGRIYYYNYNQYYPNQGYYPYYPNGGYYPYNPSYPNGGYYPYNPTYPNGGYYPYPNQGTGYIDSNGQYIQQPGQANTNIGQGPGIGNSSNNSQGPNTNIGPGNNIVNNNVNNGNVINTNPSSTNNIVPTPNVNTNSSVSPAYNNNQNNTINSDTGREIGWHAIGGERKYYQGNGSYIVNAWAEIESKYYRFNESGFALHNKWFKDTTNNSWYYLGNEYYMMTGWQQIGGVWYYFNPNRGSGYGAMYANCVLTIDGKTYAFDTEGAMIQNAWFKGSYYGQSGERTSN